MKFTVFISDLVKQKNCSQIAELFEVLGGEPVLGIGLRTFRAVASGQIPPSLKFFSALFVTLPNHMRKDAVVSYFESNLEDKKQCIKICDYLSESLNVVIDDQVESLWSQRDPQFFSEKQLNYLATSNEVVRMYNRLICHSDIELSERTSSEDKAILEDLVRNGIAIFDGKKFSKAKKLYRLPHQDNSPRELVAPASDFIVRHISAFLAREGAPGEQELGYSFHTCTRRNAEKILEQMKHFKKWVQNFGLQEDHADEVTFVWVDFARILKIDRDY